MKTATIPPIRVAPEFSIRLGIVAWPGDDNPANIHSANMP